MEWVKRGRIFAPPSGLPWIRGYASVPCAKPLDDGRVRVFFSGRDDEERSRVGSFDFDPARPESGTTLNDGSALEPGPLGSFDESGTVGSWVIDVGSDTRMYYVGWTRGVTVPFYNSIGLARSEDGGLTFQKVSVGPLVSRDQVDPYFTASSCVMIDEGVWKMWYLSCTGWEMVDGRARHSYHIRYADSDDGLNWRRLGRVCIDFQAQNEYAISRPSVVRDPDMYRMWYSHRGAGYRIGYAESDDGVVWTRKDEEAGIDVSLEGWDSEMIEYPCVFDHGARRYMLYNGNGYGATGIGLAELGQGPESVAGPLAALRIRLPPDTP